MARSVIGVPVLFYVAGALSYPFLRCVSIFYG